MPEEPPRLHDVLNWNHDFRRVYGDLKTRVEALLEPRLARDFMECFGYCWIAAIKNGPSWSPLDNLAALTPGLGNEKQREQITKFEGYVSEAEKRKNCKTLWDFLCEDD